MRDTGLINSQKRYKKYGYALGRVSTKNQAQVQHGSLEQQRNMIERWCHRQSEITGFDYEVTRYIEEDISGRGTSLNKRIGLHQIERAIRAGKIDFVVFEKLDRLSRNKIQNERFMTLASEHGVEVYEVESGRIDLRDRGSRLGFNIKNMLAEEYSLDLEEKVTKKQREARVNNGKDTSTKPILGLDPHPLKTCMYVVNEKELIIVKDIMRRFCELKSYVAVVKYCKEKNYRTKLKMTKEKIDKSGNKIPPHQVGGKTITRKNLKALLLNEKYRGYSFFKDDWNQFPDLQDENGFVRWNYAHGQIIEQDLLEKVETVAKELEGNHVAKAGKNGTYYLLSGILFAEDGSSFYGETAKEHKYYLNKKHKIRIKKSEIEKIIIERIKKYLTNCEEVQKLVESLHKHRLVGLNAIEQKIVEIDFNIKNQKSVLEKFSQTLKELALQGDTDIADVCKTLVDERKKAKIELENLEQDRAVCERQKSILKEKFGKKDFQMFFQKIMDHFDHHEDLMRKRIVQSVIPKIVYKSGKGLELEIRVREGNVTPISGFGQKKSPEPMASGDQTSNQNYGCHSGGPLFGIAEEWRG